METRTSQAERDTIARHAALGITERHGGKHAAGAIWFWGGTTKYNTLHR